MAELLPEARVAVTRVRRTSAAGRARRRAVRWSVRWFFRPALHPLVPVWLRRPWVLLLSLAQRPPRGTTVDRERFSGVACERVRMAGSRPNRTVLYLHGGGYHFGSPRVYRAIAGQLAHDLDAEVVVPDYRLAPEHPCPAGIEDAVAVHRGLVSSGRIPDLIAGDSAGGGLALAAVIALRDAGSRLPAVTALISPWVDLTVSGGSVESEARREAMLWPSGLRDAAAKYAGGQPLDDPAVSPLFAALAGLPPLVIHVGSDEILRDDAHRLADRAREAGVPVSLRTFPELWHVHQTEIGLLPEARTSVAELAADVRAYWDAAAATAG